MSKTLKICHYLFSQLKRRQTVFTSACNSIITFYNSCTHLGIVNKCSIYTRATSNLRNQHHNVSEPRTERIQNNFVMDEIPYNSIYDDQTLQILESQFTRMKGDILTDFSSRFYVAHFVIKLFRWRWKLIKIILKPYVYFSRHFLHAFSQFSMMLETIEICLLLCLRRWQKSNVAVVSIIHVACLKKCTEQLWVIAYNYLS